MCVLHPCSSTYEWHVGAPASSRYVAVAMGADRLCTGPTRRWYMASSSRMVRAFWFMSPSQGTACMGGSQGGWARGARQAGNEEAGG